MPLTVAAVVIAVKSVVLDYYMPATTYALQVLDFKVKQKVHLQEVSTKYVNSDNSLVP